MSVVQCDASVRLNDDVLLMIFGCLGARDLSNCETVCRQWQSVLSGTLWKRSFQNEMSSSLQWRLYCNKLKLDQRNIRTEDYRDTCRKMANYLNQLDDNWGSGRYITSTYPIDPSACNLRINNDLIIYVGQASVEGSCTIHFVDKESMRLKQSVDLPMDKCCFVDLHKNMMIVKLFIIVIFIDVVNGQMINVVPCSYGMRDCRFNGHLLAVCYSSNNRVSVWSVGDHRNNTLIKELTFQSEDISLEMDDRYIIVLERFEERSGETSSGDKVHVICPTTLEIKRSLDVGTSGVAYDRGLLLVFDRTGPIRTWDVESGTYLNDLHIPPECRMYASWIRGFRRVTMCSNSKYMIVNCWRLGDSKGIESTLLVFDLDAVKNRNSRVATSLHAIRLEGMTCRTMFVDETTITCHTSFYDQSSLNNEIKVFDFSPDNCGGRVE